MKKTILFALIIIITLLESADSTSSTLCVCKICNTNSNGSQSCQLTGILEVGSTYWGRVNLLDDGRTCSDDGVFCVDNVDTGDIFITYRRKTHYIHRDNGRRLRDTWCGYYYHGVEYWMDI